MTPRQACLACLERNPVALFEAALWIAAEHDASVQPAWVMNELLALQHQVSQSLPMLPVSELAQPLLRSLNALGFQQDEYHPLRPQAALLDKVLAARTFNAGFNTVEFTSSALVDMAFHTQGPVEDPIAVQAQVLETIGMPASIVMRHATPHFAHVFSGDGYSSGYYSYMWSEVMDADAFAAFEEAGDPFDPDTAARLEKHILSAGGSEEAEVLYTRFRGKMPGVEALLKGRGLLDAA